MLQERMSTDQHGIVCPSPVAKSWSSSHWTRTISRRHPSSWGEVQHQDCKLHILNLAHCQLRQDNVTSIGKGLAESTGHLQFRRVLLAIGTQRFDTMYQLSFLSGRGLVSQRLNELKIAILILVPSSSLPLPSRSPLSPSPSRLDPL